MRWFVLRRWREARMLHQASSRVPVLIRIIAVGQTLKGLVFLSAALFTARIAHVPDMQEWVMALLQRVHFDPDGERAHRILVWSTGLSHERLRLFATGLFVYAGIFLIEGIGLWFDRPWAEWLVVLGTSIFIPVEVEHLLGRPSWGVAAVLIVNLGIVAFLVRRIRQRRHASAAG